MYSVAIVCEGPTDRVILEAVLEHYFGEDYEPRAVQPPTSEVGGAAGLFGGGWKGVRSWCQSEIAGNPSGWSTLFKNNDLVIIQVDADVAAEDEIDRAKPCPPPKSNVDEVRMLIRQWLDIQALPNQLVLCVPSMASETWALVALLPNHEVNVPCDSVSAGEPCIECRIDVKSLLRARSKDIGAKLVTLKQGKPKNHAPAYREEVQERITKGWKAVMASCSEARRFNSEINAAMPRF